MKQTRPLSDLLGIIALANFVILSQWRDGPKLPRGSEIGNTERSTLPTAGSSPQTGQKADAPTDIPVQGWWQILKRTVLQIGANELLAQAAGVTFYGLLSIFPAIAATVSLYGLVADPRTISDHLDTLAGVIPGGGMDIITDQIRRLTQNPSSALSFGAAVGVVTALWSANAGSKALFSALNAVYGEKEKRNFFVLTSASLGFTVGAIAFLVIALGFIVVLPVALDFIGLKTAFTDVLQIARWAAILITIALFLACLYRFGPSRTKPRWRWVTWGSSAASVGWIALSAGFSWYVEHFGSYNKTYGSLGAAVGFMTWIWLSTTVILIGAQLNAELENQTEHDTTVGGDKPLGSRGALAKPIPWHDFRCDVGYCSTWRRRPCCCVALVVFLVVLVALPQRSHASEGAERLLSVLHPSGCGGGCGHAESVGPFWGLPTLALLLRVGSHIIFATAKARSSMRSVSISIHPRTATSEPTVGYKSKDT